MKIKNLDRRSRELMHKGVVYVNDMLPNTGQLLSYYEFIETYDMAINFIDFYGMTDEIPIQWMKCNEGKLKDCQMKQSLLQTLLQQKHCSKWAYIYLFIYFYLFGVLRRFQHCTGHITTGSWKGRGNQYI